MICYTCASDEITTYFDPLVEVRAVLNPNSLQSIFASVTSHWSSHTGLPSTNTLPDL